MFHVKRPTVHEARDLFQVKRHTSHIFAATSQRGTQCVPPTVGGADIVDVSMR